MTAKLPCNGVVGKGGWGQVCVLRAREGNMSLCLQAGGVCRRMCLPQCNGWRSVRVLACIVLTVVVREGGVKGVWHESE